MLNCSLEWTVGSSQRVIENANLKDLDLSRNLDLDLDLDYYSRL